MPESRLKRRGRQYAAAAVVAFAVLGAARTNPTEAPVAEAVMRGDTATLRRLIRQGIDVNAPQADGMTALHWAAQRGDSATTSVLVYAGARLDAITRNGNYTPLHLAARQGHAAAVRALLALGANPLAVTSSGGASALHMAAGNGDVSTVSALLDKQVPVDVRETAWGQTPLMWASAYGRIGAIKALIARGAQLELVSKVEDIPAREKADRALLQQRARRVAALKAAETPAAASASAPAPAAKPAAAPRAQGDSAKPVTGFQNRGPSYGELIGNKGGLTPLLFAVREGQMEAVRLLLESGAKIDHVSEGDHTSPLLMAVVNGRFDMAQFLMAKGANVKLASDAGATPLYAVINTQWAPKSLYPQPTAQLQQQTTHIELMEAMLKAGADPNARLNKHLWYMSYNFDLLGVNTVGATPFWRAAYGLDVPAMKLLVKYGANPNIPTIKPVGRLPGDDAPDEGAGGADPSGLAPIPDGGPGVYPIHAASGVGYGEGFAANSHRHAPDAWIPAVKYLVEELKLDVNARDHNGYNPLHHAAARGDIALIDYLVSKGTDIKAVSRRGQTTADMANGPVQRVPPFLDAVAHLVKLGSANSNKCKSC